jgi:hypothetical protein
MKMSKVYFPDTPHDVINRKRYDLLVREGYTEFVASVFRDVAFDEMPKTDRTWFFDCTFDCPEPEEKGRNDFVDCLWVTIEDDNPYYDLLKTLFRGSIHEIIQDLEKD